MIWWEKEEDKAEVQLVMYWIFKLIFTDHSSVLCERSFNFPSGYISLFLITKLQAIFPVHFCPNISSFYHCSLLPSCPELCTDTESCLHCTYNFLVSFFKNSVTFICSVLLFFKHTRTNREISIYRKPVSKEVTTVLTYLLSCVTVVLRNVHLSPAFFIMNFLVLLHRLLYFKHY